ncbi:MAG: hypothetical protein LBJ88_03260 [Campylobacteraceae bacterium]|jgi:hypothetical protein|nr:hypothetical protein [Campylobacteraceae bacterium]
MKSAVKLFLFLALTIFLSSCNKDNNQSSTDTPISNNVTKNPYSYGYDCKGYVVVNGYELPPCPDPKINDSTLLGIDINNNGVRDDVERWLIVRYKNNHKIVTEIGFQTGRAVQIVITDPSRAKETYHMLDAAQYCNWYFKYDATEFGDPILIDHDIITSTAFKTIQLDTDERIKAYLAYDRKLSGGVYRMPYPDEERAFCSFDVDTMLKE